MMCEGGFVFVGGQNEIDRALKGRRGSMGGDAHITCYLTEWQERHLRLCYFLVRRRPAIFGAVSRRKYSTGKKVDFVYS